MCEKVGYHTEKEALTAINFIRKHGTRVNGKKIPRSCYLCPFCGLYHITKKFNGEKTRRK